MKDIKCQFIGWPKSFPGKTFPLFTDDRISSKYKFIVSDNPDYVFYGSFCNYFSEITKYENAVKILFITEPISIDLMFFDYCVVFENFDCDGRNIFFPFCLYSGKVPKPPSYEQALDLIKSKEIFCDFIYGHETKSKKRIHYFNLLNNYKKVDSAGIWFNNQPNGKVINYVDKYKFQSRSKFCLAIQELKYPWFINEKITHAIIANEIPIFYGPKEVKKIFNPDRFLFVDDFDSDDDLLKRIIEIDNDDKLYAKIISQPPFIKANYQEEVLTYAVNAMDKILSNKEIVRMTQYANGRFYDSMVLAKNENIILRCFKNKWYIKPLYYLFRFFQKK